MERTEWQCAELQVNKQNIGPTWDEEHWERKHGVILKSVESEIHLYLFCSHV